MATARLPVPGDDVEVWGDILNTFLLVAHNGDGTLRDPVPDASITTKGRVRLNGDLGGTADVPTVVSTSLNAPLPLEQGGTSANTRAGAVNALLPDQLTQANKVLKTDGTNVSWADSAALTPDATTSTKGRVRLNGDISGTADTVTVVSTSLSAPLPFSQGGTSANTRVDALNALLPLQATNNDKVLKTDGSNASWISADTLVPDATTNTKGKVQLAGDISGTASAVTVVSTSLAAPLPLTQGGTGANTAQAALNALLPAQTGQGGKIIETNGTNASWVAKPVFDPSDLLAMSWMEVSP